MKDYSLNYDDSKKFILSYKIENGKIVAKLASGESYTVPYSEENENKIISRMEEQARFAQPKPLQMLDKILTISQPLMLPIAIMNFVNNGGWFYGMLLAIIAEGAIYYPAKTIINAIVNTLTELNEVNGVKILINGQENKELKKVKI